MAAHSGDVGADLGSVERGIEDLALLAPGGGDEDGAHALGVVARDRSRTLGGFVVRVGVNGEEAQAIGHRDEDIARRPPFEQPGPNVSGPGGRRMLAGAKAAAVVPWVRSVWVGTGPSQSGVRGRSER